MSRSFEQIKPGLAPAGEHKGAMMNKVLYFNWRCQGKDHRAPDNYDWMVGLLLFFATSPSPNNAVVFFSLTFGLSSPLNETNIIYG